MDVCLGGFVHEEPVGVGGGAQEVEVRVPVVTVVRGDDMCLEVEPGCPVPVGADPWLPGSVGGVVAVAGVEEGLGEDGCRFVSGHGVRVPLESS